MLQRRDAIAVGQCSVRPRRQQRVKDSLVVFTPVAQHHRLDHSGPMQVVDVVQWRARVDQSLNHLDMAQMRRRDKRGPIIGAGHQPRIIAKLDRQRHQRRVIGHRRNRDHIIGLPVQGIHIRPGIRKGAQGIVV